MITVDQALSRIFDLAPPAQTEQVRLQDAAGRVMAKSAVAGRDQPPFPASAMDGYAVCTADAVVGAQLELIGESAAGQRFNGTVRPGQTVRIFTGAPVPEGADRVVIQENVSSSDGRIKITSEPGGASYVRPAGGDFRVGDTLDAPRTLGPNDLAMLASMNIAKVTVTRKPVVALVATGDELVMPGEQPGPDQIIASNSFGLMALARNAGAEARMIPIAGDNEPSLRAAFDLANDADMIVTIGGASVGDHDLVHKVATDLGAKQAFYKIAMRPGKPLMAGKLGNALHIGLPGNPVSSMVCGHIFMLPALRAMLGLAPMPAQRKVATLTHDMDENGAREHYMRARVDGSQITAFERQDSSLLGVLAQSNALLVRPIADDLLKTGDSVEYIAI